MTGASSERQPYEAPMLIEIGALEELTLGCDKTLGATDGFTFQGQAITCTLASLANGSAREATVVDNSVNLYLDALVMLKVKSGAASTSSTGYVNVYAYGTVDGGSTSGSTARSTSAT